MEIEIRQKKYPLKLTLGALAEIESTLELQNIQALVERLKKPSANDLMAIVTALLRGGGNTIHKEELSCLDMDLNVLTENIAACFKARSTESFSEGK